MLSERVDILIRNEQDEGIAVIEVKNQLRVPADIRDEYRKQLAGYGLLTGATYFLVLSQEMGFLWKGTPLVVLDTPPLLQFSMREIIQLYTQTTDPTARRLEESEVEFLVYGWMFDLTSELRNPDTKTEKLLATTGFIDAVKRGLVVAEASV